jgi:hypothetical protein
MTKKRKNGAHASAGDLSNEAHRRAPMVQDATQRRAFERSRPPPEQGTPFPRTFANCCNPRVPGGCALQSSLCFCTSSWIAPAFFSRCGQASARGIPPRDRRKSLEAGMDGFVVKPVNAQTIRQEIERVGALQ